MRSVSSRLFGGFLPLALIGLGACGSGSGAVPGPPNVVLLISDDHDWEHLGLSGHPADPTPQLDALAARGTTFELAHAAPRCRPTLAGLLSGREAHRNGVYANASRLVLRGPKLLPRLLQQAGYRTYAEGKFWEGDPREVGLRYGPTPEQPGQPGLNAEHFVRRDQAELFAFLAEDSERPFFIWWAPKLPHTPHDPPADLAERFADFEVTVPEWIAPGEAAAFVAAERTDLAMAAWLDRGLGELLERLEQLGELDRTLLVFLIDNGWANGYLSKGSPYEKGVRTPLVVVGPGVQAGVRTDVLASYLDVFPTILERVGLEPPGHCSGRSLSPWLEGGQSPPWRDALFGAVYPKQASPENRPELDVLALYQRGPRWKYVRWIRAVAAEQADALGIQHRFLPAPTKARGSEELYDLDADPYERTNLAADPAQAARVERMRAQTLAWWSESGGLALPD